MLLLSALCNGVYDHETDGTRELANHGSMVLRFPKIKKKKNKQNIKAKQIASNLSDCDTSVVEACTLLVDGYESTIAVKK